ncbi:MAG: hypothetical protein SXQ77_03465, partial [Halobacteria archaeon]|nr:hypothetical protein [Halobacteria archaeon]
ERTTEQAQDVSSTAEQQTTQFNKVSQKAESLSRRANQLNGLLDEFKVESGEGFDVDLDVDDGDTNANGSTDDPDPDISGSLDVDPSDVGLDHMGE